MSGIILYKSRYGATKRYADWIAEKTGFSCIKTDDRDGSRWISSVGFKNDGWWRLSSLLAVFFVPEI